MSERVRDFGKYGARGVKGHEAVARQLDALAGYFTTPVTSRMTHHLIAGPDVVRTQAGVSGQAVQTYKRPTDLGDAALRDSQKVLPGPRRNTAVVHHEPVHIAGRRRLRPPGILVLPPQLPSTDHTISRLREPHLPVRHDPAEVIPAQLAGLPLPSDALGDHPAGGIVTEPDESGKVGVVGETET